LAQFEGETDKFTAEQLQKLTRQARLQQGQYDTGTLSFEVVNPSELQKLAPEAEGDIFFDLEGFSFYEHSGGLEYLFGFTALSGEEFHHRWADDREEEKASFQWFMEEALRRRSEYPGFRIYHYANYEQAAMKRLAARFESYESELKELLAAGVFVDLYKVVKSSIMISQESYSIKKLEPFYGFTRSSEVKEALGSMEYYDQYLELLGDDYNEAQKLKRQVISYNQEDCESTLALYRWLKSLS
jgi:predicted RecB family nuclease